MLPENPTETPAAAEPQRQSTALAPAWHTAMLLFCLLGASLGGARGIHPAAGHSKLPEYLWTMAWEWLLTGFVYLGIRKRTSLRELIGGSWRPPELLLRDTALAGAFWLFSMAVLGIGAHLLRLDESNRLEGMRQQIGFLIPSTTAELLVWFCVCITAGICEEIIFRGYLQRQFAAVAHSTMAGVLLSGVVFGAAHGYEGGPRMLLLGLYGVLFGVLAWWRKSLRPGMMAHAWHDAFAGIMLRLLK